MTHYYGHRASSYLSEPPLPYWTSFDPYHPKVPTCRRDVEVEVDEAGG